MAGTYDASLKDLIEQFPGDWLPLAGLSTTAPIDVIDSDISAVSGAADKVLQVQEPQGWLLHLELQSSPESDLAERLHWYNAMLRHRHRQRVRSVLILLRPEADSPGLTGVYREQFPGESPYVEFNYRAVRVWQQPVESLLQGPLGTLPLAPISAGAKADMPAVIRRIDERLEQEAAPDLREVLGAATFLLTGLRLPPEAVAHLYQGVRFMNILKDSSSYQLILQEGLAKGIAEGLVEGKRKGAIEELHDTLLHLGAKRLGLPDEATMTAIQAKTDLEHLKRMRERLLDVASWQELLATP